MDFIETNVSSHSSSLFASTQSLYSSSSSTLIMHLSKFYCSLKIIYSINKIVLNLVKTFHLVKYIKGYLLVVYSQGDFFLFVHQLKLSHSQKWSPKDDGHFHIHFIIEHNEVYRKDEFVNLHYHVLYLPLWIGIRSICQLQQTMVGFTYSKFLENRQKH